jgi:hypothetical protein
MQGRNLTYVENLVKKITNRNRLQLIYSFFEG